MSFNPEAGSRRPVVRVLVVAVSSMAQAGMAALVESVAGLDVAASLGPGAAAAIGSDFEPQVCLVDLEGARDADEVLGPLVTALGCPIVAVTEPEGFAAARSAGAVGVVTPSIPHAALAAALEAARLGVRVEYPPVTPGRGPEPQVTPAAAGAPAARPPEALTARELEVLRLMAEGLTNQQVAARLGISEHTAKFHVSAVLGKLAAQSRAEAVTQGYRLGLISV
ncbi:MAG TPA: helix-turn-helix transcriptional regulator [Candidatus Dormibacteraeota bacterium]|nr:helix-turn-helix transcriptional regulator [Candidatus Dormibacteraeota bacterium]